MARWPVDFSYSKGVPALSGVARQIWRPNLLKLLKLPPQDPRAIPPLLVNVYELFRPFSLRGS